MFQGRFGLCLFPVRWTAVLLYVTSTTTTPITTAGAISILRVCPTAVSRKQGSSLPVITAKGSVNIVINSGSPVFFNSDALVSIEQQLQQLYCLDYRIDSILRCYQYSVWCSITRTKNRWPADPSVRWQQTCAKNYCIKFFVRTKLYSYFN